MNFPHTKKRFICFSTTAEVSKADEKKQASKGVIAVKVEFFFNPNFFPSLLRTKLLTLLRFLLVLCWVMYGDDGCSFVVEKVIQYRANIVAIFNIL